MHNSFRVFVEKRHGYSAKSKNILKELKSLFHLPLLKDARLVTFYEIFNLSPEEGLEYAKEILLEPPADIFSTDFKSSEGKFIAAEYLPGQFDQRADSAQACFALLLGRDGVTVRSGQILDLSGSISDEEYSRIKDYWINPVEMREKHFDPELSPGTYPPPEKPKVLAGFTTAGRKELEKIISEYGLAMDIEDLLFTRDYFRSEGRDPYLSELRVVDTYWSDHCRHTTFETELSEVEFPSRGITRPIEEAWETYMNARDRTGRESRPVTLMDIATIWGKEMLKRGKLEDLEVSEEINAASVKIKADTPSGEIDWLMMFKNETHNHPTELEPFGGASTCIGGAIRDPLSGRAFVYQAARVTGSADPRKGPGETIKGKLPQRYITTRAAAGYSSYGNQIGLATSFVREIYDSGYAAKRMEVGAVVGGAPAEHVIREAPVPGDAVLVIGGATGRDGCGGATGSSKSHKEDSITTAGAEVQKGNAPEERKLQRLFRNKKAASKIKRCNDFGAGGACVAIGELSPGVRIHLDRLPVKYRGLSATELAISESQERMAVVVAPEDRDRMIELAAEENLEAVSAAEITDNRRLIMEYGSERVVDISRHFLDTSGVDRKTSAKIKEIDPLSAPFTPKAEGESIKEKLLNRFSRLDVAGRKGLIEMFDSTVGAGTVLMPLGGIYQETEAEASVHLLPIAGTRTASVLAAGYNPEISKWSPFHGAVYAVTETLSRIAAAGGNWERTRFSFQEYFPSPGENPEMWGLPLSALLGGLWAQASFDLPAIGGKDSMSGTFENLTVPPTLIAFGVTTARGDRVISPELKKAGNALYLLYTPRNSSLLPEVEAFKKNMKILQKGIKEGRILSAWSLKEGGLAEALAKVSFGNRLGAEIDLSSIETDLFELSYGSFLIEAEQDFDNRNAKKIGEVISSWKLKLKGEHGEETIELREVFEESRNTLSEVFPLSNSPEGEVRSEGKLQTEQTSEGFKDSMATPVIPSHPRVIIPVFYGTNCEDESTLAFEKEGAEAETVIFRNRSSSEIEESIRVLSERIRNSQILFLPGGFSAGDEPDGSGKFIVSVLKTPAVADAVSTLLEKEGLILGICNGFQALIKSGLLPYGKIGAVDETSPTLIENTVGRHISAIAPTRYTGASSPWLEGFTEGEIHHLPFSHGEGRFKAAPEVLDKLFAAGQVAFQYADLEGNPLSGENCINGSDGGVEGIISPDGRILGKMGHSERYREMLYKNYPGFRHQNIFASGVRYFK